VLLAYVVVTFCMNFGSNKSLCFGLIGMKGYCRWSLASLFDHKCCHLHPQGNMFVKIVLALKIENLSSQLAKVCVNFKSYFDLQFMDWH
jgi:hypothetical protein